MTDLEKLLKESTEIVLAVEGISSEIPKIKKLFSECRKLKTDFSALAEKREKEIQKQFEKNITRLDGVVEKMNESVRHCEEICRSFGQIEELAEIFRDYEKKLSDLEQRMDTMAHCQRPNQRKGTLLELIRSNGYRLPLLVVHEKWFDYRFEILKVSDGKAEGNLWKGNGNVEPVSYSLEVGGYSLCTSDSKERNMEFPFGMEVELPFD